MRERRGLVVVETIGSIAWFAMDACWLLGARTPALVLAAPTLVLALLTFRYVSSRWPARLVTAAMAAWVMMNVLWMANDLGVVPWGEAAAKGCLALGAALVMLAFTLGRGETLGALAGRLRRMRLRA
jgi:hypothetical protein